MLRNGYIPLWNPYSYCGQPFLAQLQPGILYPLNLLLLLFPFDFAFNAIVILHFLLGGYFTCLFLKELKASNTGALISAVTFMLSGYLLSVHNLLTHLLSVIWLPAVLLWYVRYLKEPGLRPLAWGALSLTMMFLGGGIEILYGTAISLMILAAWPDPFGTDIQSPSNSSKIMAISIVAVLFMLLSAIQILPLIEVGIHSTRIAGLPYKEAITWSLNYRDLFQFFLPDPYGYGSSTQKYWSNQCWLKTIYMGLIPFVLSLFFVVEKGRKSIPVILVLAVSLILSFGGYTPVYRFLYDYVPVFNTFRYPVKFLFIFVFFLSVLAGMGFDSYSGQIKTRSRMARNIARTLLFLSFSCAVFWGILNFYEAPITAYLKAKGIAPPAYNFIALNIHNARRFLLFVLFFGPVMVYGWHNPKRRLWFSGALLLLLTLDLFFANKGYYKTYPAGNYHAPSDNIAFLKKDPSLFRIITSPKTMTAKLKLTDVFSDSIKLDKEKVMPGFNMEHHLSTADGPGVVILQDLQRVLYCMYSVPQADSTNLLSLMNVKYVINKFEMGSGEFKPAHIAGNKNDLEASMRIYENLNVLPRAFLVEKYTVIKSDEDYRKILQSKTFDPGRTVLLDEKPSLEGAAIGNDALDAGSAASHEKQVIGPPLLKGDSGGFYNRGIPPIKTVPGSNRPWQRTSANPAPTAGQAIIGKYEPNRVEIITASSKPTLLFLSDTYFPGWRAYVNGKAVKIYRANYAFRAVPVPAGRNKIEFVYRPLTVLMGGGITLAGTILCIILACAPKQKKLSSGLELQDG